MKLREATGGFRFRCIVVMLMVWYEIDGAFSMLFHHGHSELAVLTQQQEEVILDAFRQWRALELKLELEVLLPSCAR